MIRNNVIKYDVLQHMKRAAYHDYKHGGVVMLNVNDKVKVLKKGFICNEKRRRIKVKVIEGHNEGIELWVASRELFLNFINLSEKEGRW